MKYKNFLIEWKESSYEEREWSGGHSSEGTGRYINTSAYRVLDLGTGKSTANVFNNIDDAKRFIDAFIKGTIQRKEASLRKKITSLKGKMAVLEQKKGQLVRNIYSKISELNKKESELYNQLPVTFY